MIDTSRRERAYAAMRRWYWPMVVALGLGAVVLGYIGFWRFYMAAGERPTFLDLLYRALALPQFKSGDVTPGNVPWELNVARFLGPAVLAYAALGAVIGLFATRAHHLRARLANGHVIVCGLSTKGLLTAKGLNGRGQAVVVVEHDPKRDFVRDARAHGVTVIIGDATDARVLKRAGVRRARFVLAVCSEDAVNASIADAVRQSRATDAGMITCLVHIGDLPLCSVLREQEISASSSGGLTLEFFNARERGALALLAASPPFSEHDNDDARPHLVVVGTGALAESFVSQTYARWRRRPPGAERLRITVAGAEAEMFVERLTTQSAGADWQPDLRALQGAFAPRQLDKSGLFEKDGDGAASGVYVCEDDDGQAVTNSLIAAASTRESGIPVAVSIRDTSLLSLFISARDASANSRRPAEAAGAGGGGAPLSIPDGRSGRAAFGNLQVINMLERLCDPEILFGGVHEELARAMHEDYVRQQLSRGAPPLSQPTLQPWESLPDHFKESNRDAAADLGRKLDAIHCVLVPLLDWHEELFELTPNDVETLARMEHERWMRDLESRGWTYGETRDDHAKRHPQIRPFDDLPDVEQAKDREQVRLLPTLLASIGYRPLRLADRADDLAGATSHERQQS